MPEIGKTDIKPIETVYKGYRFRSRLEARWAVFFDALGLKYDYEREGFSMSSLDKWYLPDFYLPDLEMFVEVKNKEQKMFEFDPQNHYAISVGGDDSDKVLHFANGLEHGQSIMVVRGDPYHAFLEKELPIVFYKAIPICGLGDKQFDEKLPKGEVKYFKETDSGKVVIYHNCDCENCELSSGETLCASTVVAVDDGFVCVNDVNDFLIAGQYLKTFFTMSQLEAHKGKENLLGKHAEHTAQAALFAHQARFEYGETPTVRRETQEKKSGKTPKEIWDAALKILNKTPSIPMSVGRFAGYKDGVYRLCVKKQHSAWAGMLNEEHRRKIIEKALCEAGASNPRFHAYIAGVMENV